MKARSIKLAVEALEDRSVPSTVAYGDFNNDGRLDMAAITAPKTVTVSLANLDGSYTVSAILSAPGTKTITHVGAYDSDGDGNLDVLASTSTGGGGATHTWLGNGDGSFGKPTTARWQWHDFRGF